MLMDRFEGFSDKALDWLAGIALDNSKEYFTTNKTVYELEVKGPFTAFLTELAREFGGEPKMFRPHRDVRFSADKRPYKTSASGYLQGATGGVARYVELSAEGLLAATGYYQMAADQLARFRASLTTDEEAAANAEALRLIVHRDNVQGEQLKTVPRGIPRDHPNADLLSKKSLHIFARLNEDLSNREAVLAFTAKTWRSGDPLNEWLAKNVGPTTLEFEH
jgi:uncharacterized protein (TIGR02453 family)